MTPEIIITAIVAFIAGGIFESILTSKRVRDLEKERNLLSSELAFEKAISDYLSRKVKKLTPKEDIEKLWFGEDKKTTKKVTVKKPTQKPVKEINLKTTSLGTILKKELKDPKFKAGYEKEVKRLKEKRAVKKVAKKK